MEIKEINTERKYSELFAARMADIQMRRPTLQAKQIMRTPAYKGVWIDERKK